MCLEDCGKRRTRRDFLVSAGATLAIAAVGDEIFGQQRARKALDDPKIWHKSVNFDNDGAMIEGFLTRPKKFGRYRAVIVTHGNAGLPEDVRSTAAQLAQVGFVALAVNPTSRYPDMSKFPRESLRTNEFGAVMMRDIRAGIGYLKTLPFVKAGGVGMVGFCGGGIVSLMMAALSREIEAVVALYAAPFVRVEQNSLEDPRPHIISFVEWIKVPVQAHFGTNDPYVPLADAKLFEQKIRNYNSRGEVFFYEGAEHGFANYTNDTYSPASANLAEGRMIDFFAKHLR